MFNWFRRTQTKQEHLEALLSQLKQHSDKVTGVALVSYEGMVIAQRMEPNLNQLDRAAAMGALLSEIGERVLSTLRAGEVREMFIQGTRQSVLALPLPPRGVLVVLAQPKAPVAWLIKHARRCHKKIDRIL